MIAADEEATTSVVLAAGADANRNLENHDDSTASSDDRVVLGSASRGAAASEGGSLSDSSANGSADLEAMLAMYNSGVPSNAGAAAADHTPSSPTANAIPAPIVAGSEISDIIEISPSKVPIIPTPGDTLAIFSKKLLARAI